ncbi:MAG: 3-hydroxybutyryl-CoA dehydrogenase [Acidimicrobiales bacterium mtb01]|nr:3-hydroxybutyryl-CoA dehydrogenase [Actinomycetota bacterium]TEX45668.1 MAG: 3-hydroxybutyryl-CoA dehydrogenase [Acidimicrobiales bacterium mtb01]
MTLQKIGVVGCGLMGAGIAEVSARSGCDVVVVEVTDVAAKSGLDRIEKSLERAAQRGKLSDADVDAISKRLFVTHDFEALADRELVIEAVPEIDELKVDVFKRLSRTVEASDAILATNTSSIPIMKLAMATNRPEQVVGLHFFNPVPVLPLVEVVRSLLTSDDTADRVGAFAGGQLSKNLIQSQDRAGFIVNALLIPYILSAIRMFESGFASAEDIDLGMVHGCAHPMGPLALADLIGLDTTAAVAQSMYEEFKEPLYSAPPLLLRMVDAGLLGRKSGRGFYTYNR